MNQRARAPAARTTAASQAALLHELHVHQIELEIQNEELRRAQAELAGARDRFVDLYDFAPVGYFTLDAQGVIVQYNLAGAIMLDVLRSQPRPHRFAAFVKPEFRAVFNDFLGEKLRGRCRRSCELVLLATAHRPQRYVRIQAVTDEGGNECQMAVLDATAGEHSADHDRRRNDPELPSVDDPSAPGTDVAARSMAWSPPCSVPSADRMR